MNRLRRWASGLAWLAATIVGVALVASFLPGPIDAAAWSSPPPPALEGPLAVNRDLSGGELIATAPDGPEDVAVDAEGRLYTGDEAGNIYRITLDAGAAPQAEVIANTGGRPNGLAFDPSGRLLIADLRRGLLALEPSGSITVLTDAADGAPIGMANELAVTRDGTVYFSDTTTVEGHLFRELLENRPHGRLLRYEPATGETTVVLEGLYFANGVALAPDEQFVLVAESYRYRVTRYWLAGERAGTADIFSENLPGFPDNLAVGADGTYWLALFAQRAAPVDLIHERPWVANQLARLPDGVLDVLAAPPRYGLVVQLSADGEILRSLHDPDGSVYGVTTAVPDGPYLYIGTPANGSNDVVRYTLGR